MFEKASVVVSTDWDFLKNLVEDENYTVDE